MEKVKIGIVGCGNISSQYLRFCPTFEILELAACADLDVRRAQEVSAEYSIPRAYTVQEMLDDPQIELIVNLTIPAAHAEINLKALEHGKHVYTEKPFAVELDEGQQVLRMAADKGLYVGCAPDTVLGAGTQTSRKLIDDGWIGEPLSATAFMMSPGHEFWHPSPAFFYEVGGGPMFDMGPYYLAALVQLFGPIQSVSAVAKTTYKERTITSEPLYGTKIQVETPTHIAGNMTFNSGAVATMITSYDVFAGHSLPSIEIYGSEGSIQVPDPNGFGGEVKLRRRADDEFRDVPVTHEYGDSGRGLGVADMAYAIRTQRMNRASGLVGYHVLETAHGFLRSAEQAQTYQLHSTCEQPLPMPMGGLS